MLLTRSVLAGGLPSSLLSPLLRQLARVCRCVLRVSPPAPCSSLCLPPPHWLALRLLVLPLRHSASYLPLPGLGIRLDLFPCSPSSIFKIMSVETNNFVLKLPWSQQRGVVHSSNWTQENKQNICLTHLPPSWRFHPKQRPTWVSKPISHIFSSKIAIKNV